MKSDTSKKHDFCFPCSQITSHYSLFYVIINIMKIEILLATYNGERHLPSLLDSLLDQDYKDILITISDDGSSDNTKKIIKSYIDKYPGILRDIPDIKNRGSAQNFSYLLKNSKCEFMFFADQDDIWEKDKITLFVRRYRQLKKRVPANTPILLFSDMTLIDEDDNHLSDSYYDFCKKKPKKKRLKDLLIQNNMLGCTQGFNKTLAKLTSPIPENVVMHDWWIALVASAFGKISYIDKKTIKYRQHMQNSIGARRPGLYNYKQMLPWSDKTSYIHHVNCIFEQVENLKKIYKYRLDPQKQLTIDNFLSIRNKNLFERAWIMSQNRFLRNNIHETLEFLFRYMPKIKGKPNE